MAKDLAKSQDAANVADEVENLSDEVQTKSDTVKAKSDAVRIIEFTERTPVTYDGRDVPVNVHPGMRFTVTPNNTAPIVKADRTIRPDLADGLIKAGKATEVNQ